VKEQSIIKFHFILCLSQKGTGICMVKRVGGVIALAALILFVALFLIPMSQVTPVIGISWESVFPAAEDNFSNRGTEQASEAQAPAPRQAARRLFTEDHNEATRELWSVIGSASAEEIIRLVREGADVNAIEHRVRGRHRDGSVSSWITTGTSLMQAARENPNSDVLQALIENGADIHAVTDHGRTVLMGAISNPNPDILRFLIDKGADANAVGRDGETLLMQAASVHNVNSDVLRILIENGADVNARGVTENILVSGTPLMRAALFNSNPGILQLLIENGADINIVDAKERTLLMHAAWMNSNPDVLRFLIEKGADVNAVDRYGITPLMLAVNSRSNLDFARLLIEHGADVNTADNYGRTPILSLLTRFGNIMTNFDVLQLLVESGADVNAVGKDGQTPLLLSTNLSHGIMQFLIENGADVNVSDMDGQTPLLLIAGRASPDTMRFLIEKGADVNAADNNGRTPLLVASDSNWANVDVLRFLIENGADVNASDNNGWTPLLSASARGHSSIDVLRFLIKNGADVNAANHNGMTSLMFIAASRLYPGFLRLLLENGADINMRDNEGRSALDYAERNEWLFVYHLRGVRVAGVFAGEANRRLDEAAGDINLDFFHPWSDTARLPRLDSPASLRISGDFPILDGATSAYPIYAAVANEVFDVNSKEELRRFLSVSRTAEAYNRLIRGEVDMIFVLQPSDEQLKAAEDAGVELHFTPIARDGFVFFVNARNPVSGLSIEQIRDIYRGNATNWQEIGGNDIEILPFQRPANSGSQTAMINEVMRGERLPRPRVEMVSSFMAGPVYGVAQYRDHEEAIGYSFRFFTEEMMRDAFGDIRRQTDFFQLMIDLIPVDDPNARERRERYQREIDRVMTPVKLLAIDGVYPSKENIRNGTYPFTVDVFAVTAGTSNPHVQDIVDWLLSPQGQELIEKTGYVGLR